MPGQFKISGTYYVAKNGDDANTGGATDPYETLPALPTTGTQTRVIGAGHYRLVANWSTTTGTGAKRIDTDGAVVIDANGFNIGTSVALANAAFLRGGMIIKNCPFVGGQGGQLFDTVFINCANLNHIVSTSQTLKCTIIDSSDISTTNGNNAGGNHRFNTIVNSRYRMNLNGNTKVFRNNYVDKDSQLITGAMVEANITDNCINGIIRQSDAGTQYELKFLKDGSPRPDANGAIADIATLYAWFYTSGNFASVNVGMIDPINRLIRSDSDLTHVLGEHGFIGGTSFASEIKVSDDNGSTINITTDDIDTTDPNEYFVDSSANEGYIDFIFRIANVLSVVPPYEYIGSLFFDSDETPGTAANNNVPDSFPLSNPLPGSDDDVLPNRLTYLMRTSKQSAKPTTDGEWDNDFADAGVFYPQQWGSQPRLYLSGGVYYGSGQQETADNPGNRIRARWVHIRAYLRNNRDY